MEGKATTNIYCNFMVQKGDKSQGGNYTIENKILANHFGRFCNGKKLMALDDAMLMYSNSTTKFLSHL